MVDEVKNNLDEQKKKIALDWLGEKWPINKRVCDVCGHSQWNLAEDIIAPMAFSEGSIMLGGRSYPQLMVICTNCGNTKYFNAVMIGLVKGEQDAKQPS